MVSTGKGHVSSGRKGEQGEIGNPKLISNFHCKVLTPAVARVIADLRVDPETEAEVQRLREKANEGTLTSETEDAYRDIVEAADVISIIQSKAQRFLARHSS